MRAFIVSHDNPDTFDQVEVEKPTPAGRDLLIAVKAVALNPVDTKVRRKRAGKILGWDASGVVAAVGPEVKHYAVGDEVYYAGDITRPGCNADFQLVDERIVGRKPKGLSHLSAAALPLTALTAWEGLYEQLRVPGVPGVPGVQDGKSILVINSAGGVGSLVCQLAKRISGMTVIGTASRPDSIEWSRKMGADHVIDHHKDIPGQLEALGYARVDYIFCCHDTRGHFDAMAQVIAPQGHIVSIVEADEPLPMIKLFSKKVSFSWELMYTKSMYQTADMDSQREILNRVASLIEEGVLESTLREDGGTLTAGALTEAHRRQASASLIGKQAFSMPGA